MRHHTLSRLLLLPAITTFALGQVGAGKPSNDEIFELLVKASEKIDSFEDAVKGARGDLDKADPKLTKNYLDAATKARQIVLAIRKSGPAAYSLVALMSTMDDISLDAATASAVLLLIPDESERSSSSIHGEVILLMTVKNACNDISELIMHATLRYIHAEEELLETLLKKK